MANETSDKKLLHVPVIEESMDVRKLEKVISEVEITKEVEYKNVNLPLTRLDHTVEIERNAVPEMLLDSAPPAESKDGDTTTYRVIKEVPVVVTKYQVIEEITVRKITTQTEQPTVIPVRQERLVVTRTNNKNKDHQV